MSDTYRCAHCGGVFDKGWSDKAANFEAKHYFGVANASSDPRMATVCDDCFQKMHPKDHPKLVEAAKEALSNGNGSDSQGGFDAS